MRAAIRRVRTMFRSRQLDAELDEELRTHLDLLAADYEARGLSPSDARLAARRAFGGVLRTKELYRDRRGIPWMSALARDVRFGARLLVRDRWLTAGVVGSLAMGLAANTVVFTLVNGILLRDLPFDDPDRLVTVGSRVAGNSAGLSYLDFEDWSDGARTLVAFAAASDATMNVADDRRAPERFAGSYVSANIFSLVGQQPMLGRGFSPVDDRPGAEPVVILAHSVWSSRYGADPGVIGRVVRINGVASVIVGVMPPGFAFPARSRIWTPLALLRSELRSARDARVVAGFGRLARTATLEQAQDDLLRVSAASSREHPALNGHVQATVALFSDRARGGGRLRAAFPPLMAMVGFVLLIACANAANLQLARAAARSREMAVRLAVGASRGQIVRQLLVESLLLAGCAAIAALAIAVPAVSAFSNAVSGGDAGLPYWITFSIDWSVFTYLALLCVATALLSGVAPALHMARTSTAGSLTESSAACTSSVRRRRWTSTLVTGQLALTPILLVGGGLMMRSVVAQQDIDPGVDTHGIIRMRLDLAGPRYASIEQRSLFYGELEQRLATDASVPAALASHAPFEGAARRRLVIDTPSAPSGSQPVVGMLAIGGDYFGVFGTRLLRGRTFAAGEGRRDPIPAIVNERFAAEYTTADDPIGRVITLATIGGAPVRSQFTIVGIAPDVRQRSTEDGRPLEPLVYVPYASTPLPSVSLLARSPAAPAAVASMVRERVSALDPDIALYGIMTLDESLAESDERLGLLVFGTIFTAFAAIALLLATVGLYAVTAYATSQRTREIGIRVALGARPRQIGWLVTSRASRQVAIGLAIGMAGALALGQILRGLLIGVSPADPVTLGGVALLLAGTTFAAAYAPARRAMRVNPVYALRLE